MNSQLPRQHVSKEFPLFDKKGVFWFLGLTFGLTWLLDLAGYLYGGLGISGASNFLGLRMLMPAFSAILLGLFFFPDSPIYYKRPAGRGRWFYYFYLLLTVITIPIVLSELLAPTNRSLMLAAASTIQLMGILVLLALIALSFIAGRQVMARIWLVWGSWRYWLIFSLAFVGYDILQVALDAIFGLGPTHLTPFPAPAGFNPNTYTILSTVAWLLMGSVLSFTAGFGEEYGWRGYLQSELFKLGRVRGVILLGVIWGIWHWPVVLMGHNFPGHPLLGLVLQVFYNICLSIVLGYAVLRSGSVLLAAYLHALYNVFFMQLVNVRLLPFDNAFSFIIGIYGIPVMTIVALLILRDPIWQGKGSSLSQPAPTPEALALSCDPGVVEKAAERAKLGNVS